MYRIKVIYNPQANHGMITRVVDGLRAKSRTLGEAVWSKTEFRGQAVSLARQAAADGYQRIVAIGGDGTLHEIVNGLMQVPAQHRPQLGIVPLGSGNDFVIGVGVTANPAQALQHAFDNTAVRVIDIGTVRINGGEVQYWCNALGIGFDAAVNLQSRRIKWLRGQAMYFVAAVRTIIANYDAPQLTMESDGRSHQQRVQMLTIGNGTREGGGFITTPEARVDDGLLDYAMFQPMSRAMMLRLIPEVMRGTHGRFRQVRMGRVKSLSLRSDRPLLIHADGEVMADHEDNVRSVEVGIVPATLTLIS